MEIQPVPVSQTVVCQYSAYLARRLKPSSVRQYLNVIRLLHLESGYDNPCVDNWMLKSTLKGMERTLGSDVTRKEPINPEMLISIKKHLKLHELKDAMFWAVCLVLFFGTFRKSNLMPNSKGEFSAAKQFVRSDFVVAPSGDIYLTVRWSKTIQCKEREYMVKLPKLSGSLSPACAVLRAFGLVPLPPGMPAFVSDITGTPMTGKDFQKILKDKLKYCGYDTKIYSSHSFRRGSAVWAMKSGIPSEVVKYMGDWKSSAYLAYLDTVPKSMYEFYSNKFCSHLP